MSWVTIIWSMTASACLTLAAIYLLVWFKRRSALDYLLFSFTSAAVAVYTGIELWMLRAQTPAQFATELRWIHVPVWVLVLSLVGFVRLHLKAGRLWLAWTVGGLRTLALVLNFLVGQNLNYRAVTHLRHVSFLGEFAPIAEGVSNPWMLVGQLSLLLLLIFTADAGITAWRRGERRQALATGGSIVFFTLAGVVQSLLVFWHVMELPLTASLFFLGIVLAMGYELSRETLRAAQLSDALRESEARMTLAAEAAGVGIWVWSIATNRVWGSERWFRLFGFEPGANVSYEEVFQRIHPDDREDVDSAVRDAVETGADYVGEYRVIPPNGSVRWLAARGRNHLDPHGKPNQMMGASVDVTERNQAVEELRQSEELKKAILDSVAAHIAVLDSRGVIVAVNANWRQFALENPTGTDQPPRNIGLGANYLEVCRQSSGESGDSAMAAHDGIQGVIQGRLKSFALEYASHSPEKQRWFAMSVTPLGLEKRSAVVAHLEITERKQAEQKIAQQRNEVAHLARVTTLGEISGSLAHELNQPLGAILVNTDAAELHLQRQTPNLDEVLAILADIRKDGLRAGDIIHGIRAFLRRKQLEMQPLEVGQMAQEVLKLISADAAAHKTSVDLEIPANLPRVQGDRVHLQQVLLNLLVNAMDAMNTCPVADRRITIRAARPDARTVEIAVSDAGVGIPPVELDKIFVPFHTTKQGGLGLGLSICRSIIEAHGGSIAIENNSDRGTTARFTLPVCG